jgi:hypothetical protein
MTPKEKAKELVIKFNKIDSDSEMFDGFKMTLFYSQRCALIAVDELIYETQFEVPNIRQKYWIEVKKEIERL